MLVLEDLISKMKIHFPRWMDIRRKIKTSSGGQLLCSIAEEISEISGAIEDYKRDFFIDKYIGREEEVTTYIYRYHIGITEIESIKIISPEGHSLTDDEKEFHANEDMVYYNEGFLYTKKEWIGLEYSIDNYNSVAIPEKIHVWNIFDEFAAFVGLRRFQWESNLELLNRILAFANNRANSSEDGIKNAILNNLINIDNSLTADDILIERPTPENLNKYYDEFETVLEHLANINRDVYRTKRWDLDTWNFEIKSVDYIPHAWDVILKLYSNGVGFEDDLKVEIVDSDMSTDATIYFYKRTLEYINSYIKNNSIKETVKLDLVKHSNELSPINVKYRINATELEVLNPSNIFAESYDYKVGEINQTVNDLFDEQVNDYNDIDIIDTSILDSSKRYKLRFKSLEELKEMSINKLYILNTKNNKTRSIIVDKPGFERTVENGIRCSLTKKYISEKYHFSNIKNAHKEIEGFVISNVQEPTCLESYIDACHNEPIYYEYECEEIPVLFHNIEKVNCYIQNNSIISDTVTGEKYIALNINANSFSCNIHGPNKIIYSVDGNTPKTLTNEINDTHNFSIGKYDMPKSISVKIILNPVGNMQCAVTDIMYSKYEFEVTTDKGPIVEISGQKRLPNFMYNTLKVNMKTYTGFSPVLKYIYIGTKVENITYGDIDIIPEDGDIIVMDKSNCVAELETYTRFIQEDTENEEADFRLDSIDLDYTASKIIVGKSNESYIEINLDNFKEYKNIYAERCIFEAITYGSQVKNIIKIPNGVHLKEVSITGEYEKLIFKETLELILSRRGYSSNNYTFSVAKTNDNIIIRNIETDNVNMLQLRREDLISYNAAKIKFVMNRDDIQTIFVESGVNKTSDIANECDTNFNLISFYPTATKIYKAINEYNVISPTTVVPQIINTFDNDYIIYNEKTLYYTIESLNEDFDVSFNKDGMLRTYSIDSNPIQITKKDMNNLLFDFESITVTYDSIIGNTIDIPESFTMNKEKIETSKYIIKNDDLDILYLNKYSDKLHERDYVQTEIITVTDVKCNKLKYCNINEIEEIYLNTDETDLVEGIDYSIKFKEGIIHWYDSESINKGAKIFIRYNINKPKYIRLTLEQLYQKVNFSTNAYELLGTVDLYAINNNDSFNLSMYKEYDESDLISVKCSNIGFEATVKGASLTFEKNLKNNTVAVKSGYYYLDGDEYFLFADENRNNIEQIDNLYFFNVTKENKKLYFNQTTSNMVSNSALKSNANGVIFNLDCKDKNIKGISNINSITTCENFNHWKSVGMNMSIVKGLNGLGIKFESIKSFEGYSYLDISKHIPTDDKRYVISFYMNGTGSAYLGEERKIYSQVNEFNKQSIIEAKVQAVESLIEDNIYEIEFLNSNAKKHYLIVKGNVTVDDIIVQPKDEYSIDYHTKNISYLNLDIVENIYANFETRLYLDDTEGAIFDGTEFKDDCIVNSSYIDWGFTKTHEIYSYEQYKKCELENVDLIQHNNNCYVKTSESSGQLTTESIYIGNINTIKNIMFKINDVMFDNMKNFKVRVLTSSNAVTGFKEISVHLDNIGSINAEYLSSYIKLIVEMPQNKVINNIELYTEYLSDDVYNPPEVPVVSGSYVSKVLDAQYNTRFLVKNLGYELINVDFTNVVFSIRASKENTENTVWTDWKQLKFLKNEEGNYYLDNRIVFEDYRYFQFRTILKGVNASVKIKNLDLEVI